MTQPLDRFVDRHIGPRPADIQQMLAILGLDSLDALVDQAVPASIRLTEPVALEPPRSQAQALKELTRISQANRVLRSYLGQGYHGTHTPPVIQRNVLENPGWYTAYTPYQAEVAQGRLEALLIFQTMIQDLTGMDIANASLLDEGTAAAEAMAMAHRVARGKRPRFLASDRCHPQTLAVMRTRARSLGIDLQVGDLEEIGPEVCGVLAQYPDTDGRIEELQPLADRAHQAGALLVVAADVLALTVLRSPGESGADIVVGNTQRFGVPMGYGGPHAAFLATLDRNRRQAPGRIIGVSKDADGQTALRMALQTREQHIRRQKATSNICTAQVLLAVMAGMYGVWHGPEGLTRIARRLRDHAATLAHALRGAGFALPQGPVFDTLAIDTGSTERADKVVADALELGINLRTDGGPRVFVALDETVEDDDITDILAAFGVDHFEPATAPELPAALARTSDFLTHEVFHAHRSETEMMRFLHRLESRDIALNTSMTPLGSCTMKLNAAAEMMPISWAGFAALHPFAPADQAQGYKQLVAQLGLWLCEITGYDAFSFQPNAGSQGEYTGLMTIAAWHAHRGEPGRNVCLIPTSAHGTNPASAVMAGFKVVAVACDEQGNIDVDDLRAKADQHAEHLGALMVTYPSTHGVYETAIREICEIVHAKGGQVYMDGANLNALVGVARPGEFGADVGHLNLHKTFAIPHGGGGPGVGPVGARAHLAPFLPGHPMVPTGGEHSLGTVSSAPFGSPSILPISWAYIALLGGEGLRRATEVAILNANYIAARLGQAYPVVYTGDHGRVAHECILDLRHFHKVGAEDVAKRLMDFGFHAPTLSFPVAGTLMVEPTESESKEELDRFCEAMLAIREEIRQVEEGELPFADSALHHAPHTAQAVTADEWERPYTRRQAAFPLEWVAERKVWPGCARVDNTWGDRNLFCSCDAWDLLDEQEG